MPMKKLNLTISHREVRGGFILLFLVFACIPYLLSILNQQLSAPLNAAALNFIYHTVNFIGVFMVFRWFLKESLQLPTQYTRILLYTVLGILIYFGLVVGLSRFILWLKPNFANLNDSNIAGQLDKQQTFVIIGTVIMAPFTEELLFRAHVFGHLYNKHPAMAYVLSMCAFSVVHILGYIGSADITTLLLSFLQYLPAGWVLAWTYAQTGVIFTPIIIHTLINAIGIYTMR